MPPGPELNCHDTGELSAPAASSATTVNVCGPSEPGNSETVASPPAPPVALTADRVPPSSQYR
jgi:hypothetical protein